MLRVSTRSSKGKKNTVFPVRAFQLRFWHNIDKTLLLYMTWWMSPKLGWIWTTLLDRVESQFSPPWAERWSGVYCHSLTHLTIQVLPETFKPCMLHNECKLLSFRGNWLLWLILLVLPDTLTELHSSPASCSFFLQYLALNSTFASQTAWPRLLFLSTNSS